MRGNLLPRLPFQRLHLLVVALLAAGCGGSESPANGSPDGQTPLDQDGGDAATSPADATDAKTADIAADSEAASEADATQNDVASGDDGDAAGEDGDALGDDADALTEASDLDAQAPDGDAYTDCVNAQDCPGSDDECQHRTCSEGTCGMAFTPANTPAGTQVTGDCKQQVCDGAGNATTIEDPADPFDDQNPCTDDLCKNGAPDNPPSASGTACSVGSGTRCNGAGQCVECLDDPDCASKVCVAFKCVDAKCGDGKQNGNETDTDCGGDTCAGCADAKHCVAHRDCQDLLLCNGGTCGLAPCANGLKDGNETDVDCGGDTCATCANDKSCLGNHDCTSGKCASQLCAAPACPDGVKNGTETDVDCGGTLCPACASGNHCTLNKDCQSGLACRAGVCGPTTCVDGSKNAGETDVDCGGPCAPCANGKQCLGNADCLNGHCTAGLCVQAECMTIPVGSKPVGVASDGTHVWVANEGSDNVYKIDASSGTTESVFTSGVSAQYVTFDGTNIWVTNPVDDNVTKFDQNGPVQSYDTGASPAYPDGIISVGAYIWVANYQGGTVAKLDATTGALVNTIQVDGNPRFLAYDGKHVWVTVPGARPVTSSTHDVVKKVLVKDDHTDAVVGTFDVSAPPYVAYPYAITFDGEYLWITLGSLNTVAKLATTGAIVGVYPAGFGPNGIAFDGANIWITDQICACVPGMTPGCTSCPPGAVTKLRASDGASLGSYWVGARPQWVAHDGQYLWVTNGSDDTVSRCTPW